MRIKFYMTLMVILLAMWQTKLFAQTDYATIITNVTTNLKATYPSYYNSNVKADTGLLNSSGRFTDLTYGTATNAIDDATWVSHLFRLKQFALAYTIADGRSNFYSNTTLYNKIVLALQYFNSNGQAYVNSNWFNRQIGNPQTLGQILILMRGGSSTLTSADENNALNYWTGLSSPSSETGANEIDEAIRDIYRGALIANGTVIAIAVNYAAATIPLSASETDGTNYDYAFLQHGPQLQTQSYGAVWIADIYMVANYVKNTSFAFSSSQLNIPYIFLHNSYYGAARGKYKDFSLDGRGLSRPGNNGVIATTIGQQALLVDTDPTHIANLKTDTANTSSQTISSGNSFVSPQHIHYWTGDYTLHNRPGYQFSVRGVSTRTVRSEGNIGGENLLGLFLTDGATNIRVTGNEYYNIFPVWDWNLVPGITMRQFATQQTNTNLFGVNGTYGSTSFVGGVSDTTYGASTYQLNFDAVQARKSWFFFDNEIVCLGAGITSTGTTENVATCVNQTVLSGTAYVSSGGTASALSTHTQSSYYNNLSWAWHNSIAYFFPKGGNVTVSNQTQTGNWNMINSGQSTTTVNTDVFKLSLNHGVTPSNGTYAYIVVPNLAYASTASYNISNIKIVSNTASIQAVKHNGLNILQVIFAAAGTVTDSTSGLAVTVNQPCALMIKNVGSKKVAVSVSDPSQLTATIKVSVKFSAGGKSYDTFFNTPSGNYKGNSNSFSVDSTVSIKNYSPVADAYVQGGTSASANFGTATTLIVKNSGVNNSYTREVYLKFDLHGLKANWARARLRLYGNGSAGANTVNLAVYRVTDNTWTETGVTYNNRPAAVTVLDSIPGKAGGLYREWFVMTNAINTIGIDSLISLKIMATTVGSGTSDVSFTSREGSNADQRPVLMIDSVPPLSNTITSIADAYVQGGTSATANFGTATALIVKNSGVNNSYTRETFLKFDMHGVVPKNLINAKLQLYGNGNTTANTVNWSVYKVTDNTWTETGITYNNRPTATVALDSIQGKVGAAYSKWDITAAVKTMSSDSILSLKVYVTTTGSSASDVSFSAREVTTAGQRPCIVFNVDTTRNNVINYASKQNPPDSGMTKVATVTPSPLTKPIGSHIIVHQALSPNGDGVNDFLSIEGLENYPSNHVLIINRIGGKVFETDHYDNAENAFTGKSKNGDRLPAGTYFYVINYQDGARKAQVTGYLVLKY